MNNKSIYTSKLEVDSPFSTQKGFLFKATINGERYYVINFCNPKINYYAFKKLEVGCEVYSFFLCFQFCGSDNTMGYNFKTNLKDVDKDVYIKFNLHEEDIDITVDDGKILKIKYK